MRCPYCNAATDHIEPEKLAGVLGLVGHQRAIVDELSASPGAVIGSAQLMDAMYDLDINGGALTAQTVLKVIAFRLRPKLLRCNYTIEGKKGQHGGYRLTPISPHPDTNSKDQRGGA